MPLYGLIGYPLAQSDSKIIFEKKFKQEGLADSEFRLFPLHNINELSGMITANSDLKGFAVTIPYKQQIFPFLSEISAEATAIGAVNCVKVSADKLVGYNTDVVGFEKSLLPLLQSSEAKALVLGNGGASKAVQFVLHKNKIPFTLVTRKPSSAEEITYADIHRSVIDNCNLLINTTPVGMYPNNDRYPDIPYQFISSRHLLYDLVYKPAPTLFLQKGAAMGAATKDGYEMLELQAMKNWEIWNDISS